MRGKIKDISTWCMHFFKSIHSPKNTQYIFMVSLNTHMARNSITVNIIQQQKEALQILVTLNLRTLDQQLSKSYICTVTMKVE
jgi:hypothetical protein